MKGYASMSWPRVVFVPLAALLACESDSASGPNATGEYSTAFGRWQPGPFDTCTAAQHDRYSTVGPVGVLYPTWHPPVEPEGGCSYGHDHGRDPRGSDLSSEVGPIPFGFANEALVAYDPNTVRHEDHVGHKIEWENDVEMRFNDAVSQSLFRVTCDVLTKLHQGTHSKDAYTNNLHELAYHIRCSDGTGMSVTIMAAIGEPGEFVSSCDGRHIQAGPPNPLGSPSGGGKRIIADRQCVVEHVLVPDGERSSFSSGLRESWQVSQSIRTEGGHRLAHINPYFQVLFPSRYFDPVAVDGVARPMDLCYEVEPNGDQTRDSICEEVTADRSILGITYDDPRTAFDGAQRFVDINSNSVTNADGPDVWYTDPFGHHARVEPFTGSIRQFIARIDNERGIGLSGPNIGRERDYGDRSSGVHPPN
jgi:hypothetical protein